MNRYTSGSDQQKVSKISSKNEKLSFWRYTISHNLATQLHLFLMSPIKRQTMIYEPLRPDNWIATTNAYMSLCHSTFLGWVACLLYLGLLKPGLTGWGTAFSPERFSSIIPPAPPPHTHTLTQHPTQLTPASAAGGPKYTFTRHCCVDVLFIFKCPVLICNVLS